MQKKLIIVLIGLASSGKDTIADYLVGKDFLHLSLSATLKEICIKQGGYRGRDDLIRMGNYLRKRYGVGYLAKKTTEKKEAQRSRSLVLSSVRNPGEITELKKHGLVFTIAVTAPRTVRYARAKKRGRIEDAVTYQKFSAQELRERKGSATQQQLDKLLASAEYIIINNSSLPALYKKVELVLGKIRKQQRKVMPHNIVILGPQGSGKGTQAEMLVKKFNLFHVEMGMILRRLAKKNTPFGHTIGIIINKQGGLVPDEVVKKALLEKLRSVPVSRGILFDGFPRNLRQARMLDTIFTALDRELTEVIFLPIARKTTIQRLSLRRTCEKCSRIFIAGVSIPKHKKRCIYCKGAIIQREDDKPKAIAKRLSVYAKLTKPVVTYYKKQGTLITVNGEPSIKVVSKNILKYF